MPLGVEVARHSQGNRQLTGHRLKLHCYYRSTYDKTVDTLSRTAARSTSIEGFGIC